MTWLLVNLIVYVLTTIKLDNQTFFNTDKINYTARGHNSKFFDDAIFVPVCYQALKSKLGQKEQVNNLEL